MGPSVQAGRQELVNEILAHTSNPEYSGKIALTGYSQGALVVDYVWRDDILHPDGVLHHLVNDVIGIVNFGDPMRAPGICNGNVHAGFPVPKKVNGFTTGGIAGPNDLKPEETPNFLLSCNNDGDLYGAAPVGDSPWTSETGVGHDETLVFNIVQDFSIENVLAIAQEAMSLLGIAAPGLNLGSLINLGIGAIQGALGKVPASGATTPSHVIALVEALLNGGMFVASGFGPHGDYEKFMPAMVDFLNRVGKENQ